MERNSGQPERENKPPCCQQGGGRLYHGRRLRGPILTHYFAAIMKFVLLVSLLLLHLAQAVPASFRTKGGPPDAHGVWSGAPYFTHGYGTGFQIGSRYSWIYHAYGAFVTQRGEMGGLLTDRAPTLFAVCALTVLSTPPARQLFILGVHRQG